ncbi:MAG TPA: hypothetical protein VHX99_05015, partial [Rhizomicrobium sp.]|nr:hypothetical protein [Rhizomicrobium sp.]
LGTWRYLMKPEQRESPMVKHVDAPARDAEIGSFRVDQIDANSATVTVASGTLAGRHVRIITVPPSSAYFNEPEEKRRA